MSKKKILSLDDLYNFYSTKKKSMSFSSEKSGYNIAVQVKGKFEVQDENTEGLMFGRCKAFHDLSNLNKSYIETDVLESKSKSINNRPILADIIEYEDENGEMVKDFYGHSMEYNEETGKMKYIEIPIGHFINPENITIEYDKEKDRSFVNCDVVIYEEYTDACDILRRKGGTDVSVELVIRDMSWDCANKVLKINDFYVQGCTCLGTTPNGEKVKPGMDGSKLTLKDFSESNNSMFSEGSIDKQELIEMQEKINKLLSRFNIDENDKSQKDFEEGGNNDTMTKFEKLMQQYNKTQEDITFETEGLSDEELEAKFEEVFGEKDPEDETQEDENTDGEDTTEDPNSEEDCEPDDTTENSNEGETATVTETEEKDDSTTEENSEDENVKEDEACGGKKKKYSKTFELDFDSIKTALYQLLAPLEESSNDWYWIVSIFDSHFVYQSCMGNYFGMKYTKDGDTVAFDGEPYALYAEFLTETEKAELNSMRQNYSSISEKLSKYEEAESIADKMTVFEDEAYTNYLETESFKELMKEENVKKFTKEELAKEADAALGKEVKISKTFSLNIGEKETKKKPMFAFAKVETNTGFLDGLLKK